MITVSQSTLAKAHVAPGLEVVNTSTQDLHP